MRPMLATPTPVPGRLPVGPEWTYEVKWDGMRVLADASDGRLRLNSRTERDVTVAFPELDVLACLPDALLDGEVITLDDAGLPSFPVLMDRIHVREQRRAAALAQQVPVTFVVFDVLRLHGVDLTTRPLWERRATLERLDLPAGAVQLSPLYPDGPSLLDATREQGLEGAVAKRRGSVYRPGERSRDWVKAAHRPARTCVVGGWRPEVDTERRIGSLLVGAPDGEGGLRFLGRVGSGIGRTAREELSRLLLPLATTAPPFTNPVPRVDAVGAAWVRPVVTVEVHHLGWTTGGRLRQPAFRGVRLDADPDPVGAR